MIKRKLIPLLIGSLCIIAGTVTAEDVTDNSRAIVFEDETGFMVDGPNNTMLKNIVVEVASLEGKIISRQESLGETIVFDPNNSLPDGRYRMTVTTNVFVDEETSKQMQGNPEYLSSVRRVHFSVIDGRKVTDDEFIRTRVERAQNGNPQANSAEQPRSLWVSLASQVVDFLVPSAHAVDVVVSDSTPEIFFDDTDTNVDSGQEASWAIFGNGGTTNGYYRIRNYVGADANTSVFLIDQDDATAHDNQDNAIWVQNSGDVWLNNGGASFDLSSNQLVIGTTTPFNDTGTVDLEIATPDPYIYLHDTDNGLGMGLWQNGEWFNFEADANAGFPEIVRFNVGAPAFSMQLTAAGVISVANKIHVGSSDEPVGQFTITTPDQPRFEMNDTTTGERWRFSVASDKFAINQLINGGTEFQVFNNGDVLIGGALTQNSDRDAKQDIVPVDHLSVLDRIVALPISEWSYKDAPDQRHIGPMAQDFHATFGLGRNDEGISTLDTSGVALAGIKALKWQNDRLAKENAELKARMEAMENRQVEIMATLATMRAQLSEPAPVVASLEK